MEDWVIALVVLILLILVYIWNPPKQPESTDVAEPGTMGYALHSILDGSKLGMVAPKKAKYNVLSRKKEGDQVS